MRHLIYIFPVLICIALGQSNDYCKFGEAYWCKDLQTAKECDAVTHCIHKWKVSQIKPKISKGNSIECGTCELIVIDLGELFTNKVVEDEAVTLVEKACSMIPNAEASGTCKMVIKRFLPEIMKMISSELKPEQICTALKMCSRTAIKIKSFNFGNKTTCSDCEKFIADLRDMITSQATIDEIENAIKTTVCSLLTGELRNVCETAVDENIPDFLKMLASKLDGHAICQLYGFCDKERFPLARLPQLRHAMTSLITVGLNMEGSQSSDCPDCLSLIKQLKALLSQTKTQQNIAALLKTQFCTKFPDITGECQIYVDKMLPVALELMVSNLTPQVVCKAIGDCTALKYMRRRVNGPVSCPQCTKIIGQIKVFLNQNKTFQILSDFMKNKFCAHFPAIQSECQIYVGRMLPVLLQVIQTNIDSKSVCKKIGDCSASKKMHRLPLMFILPSYKASKLNGAVNCTECMKIVGQVKTFLAQNKTVETIANFMKSQFCSKFPAIESLCHKYVDQMLPVLIQMASKSMDPSAVCKAIGDCSTGRKMTRLSLLKVLPRFTQLPSSPQECSQCKEVVQKAKDFLVEAKTQAEIEDFLKMEGCQRFPAAVQKRCEEYIVEYLPLVISLLKTEMDPVKICQVLGACGKSSLRPRENLVFKRGAKASTKCVICEWVMKEVDRMIANNRTEEVIEKALDKVCMLLPSSLSAECKSFVAEYAPAIVELIVNEASPQAVCQLLGLCANRATPHTAKGSVMKVRVVEGTRTCDTCQIVMQYAIGLLKENATVQEVEEVLEKVCNFLPTSLHAECDQLIEQYAPMIIQLLVTEFNPKEICTVLDLCNNSVLLRDNSVPLIGGSRCTWGPSYWCANRLNALRCKAVRHCQQHFWRKTHDVL